MFGFELLKADDIRLRFRQPSHQIIQALIDVVDVECGDLQTFRLELQNYCVLIYGVTIPVPSTIWI